MDIVVAINRHAVGTTLIVNHWFHEKSVRLAAAGICVTKEPQPGFGLCWELFAGSARWTTALTKAGWGALTPVEILDDARHDILSVLFLEVVFRVAKARVVQLVHSGTPCSSLSRAITPAWRDASFPMGLPSLSGTAKAKVEQGNSLTNTAMSILKMFHDHDAAVSDENSETSFHWQMPAVTALYTSALFYVALIDVCQFSTLYKKGTKIRGNYRALLLLGRRCCCKSKHSVILRGSVKVDGRWVTRTSLASPYPLPLVNLWAEVVCDLCCTMSLQNTCDFVAAKTHSSFRSEDLLGPDLNLTGLGDTRLVSAGVTIRYSHIDDRATIGPDAVSVQTKAEQWYSNIVKAGFIVKEPPVAEAQERYIGFSSQVSPGRWQLPPKLLARLDRALLWLTQQRTVQVSVLRSVTGVIVWVLLLRRSMLSILYTVFDIFRNYEDMQVIKISSALRGELMTVRRILPLVYGDTGRLVSPVVLAQDAEGGGENDLGGWGCGCAVPEPKSVVSLALKMLSRTVPQDVQLLSGDIHIAAGPYGYSDEAVPVDWITDLTWYDLLAREHHHYEHIHIHEARALLRSLEIATKTGVFRRSYMLALEDNQAVVGAFAKGRSTNYNFSGTNC